MRRPLPVTELPMCLLCRLRRATFRVRGGGWVCDSCSADRPQQLLVIPRSGR